MKKEEGIIRRIYGTFVKVSNALSIIQWYYVLFPSGGLAWVSILLWNNPLFLILFGVSLAVAGFAIFAIFVNLQQKKLLDKKIPLTGFEIETDESGDNPKVLITQRFANMFDEPIKLSKVDIMVKAGIKDKKELDEFFYSPPNRVQHLGDKIKTSSSNEFFPALEPKCWIRFETTKLSQVISDYHGKEIRIDVVEGGIIEFTRGIAKISKEIVDGRSVKFKRKPYPPVY